MTVLSLPKSAQAHAVNESSATWSENAIHFFEPPNRSAEILEGSTAKHEIKGLGLERHVRSIAVPEINGNSRFERVSAGYFNERLADINSGDSVSPEFRQFDREVSRPRREFQQSASWREFFLQPAEQGRRIRPTPCV
jgi:hypothetical protein